MNVAKRATEHANAITLMMIQIANASKLILKNAVSIIGVKVSKNVLKIKKLAVLMVVLKDIFGLSTT